MALRWNMKRRKRIKIKDKNGNVVCIAVAAGKKSAPCEKVLLFWPNELTPAKRKAYNNG